MALFELKNNEILPVPTTTFAAERVRERQSLQARLRDQIELVAPGCFVLAEEFGDWDDSRRRIDLLCVDKAANLVVVELKRTEDGGAMELQAIRYAAMVSTMTFEQAVHAHQVYLQARGFDRDARQSLLEFLEWETEDDGRFADDIRIVLVSADFSRELTTSVMWLNERDLDVRCIQLRPYKLDCKVLLDIEQVVPLKSAEEYQIRVRAKEREERRVGQSARDYTKFDVTIGSETRTGLAKRHAAFTVIKHLCDLGITPEAISDVINWRSFNSLWMKVPGLIDDEGEFVAMAQAGFEATGRTFERHRWFARGDQLVRHQGTYALTTQWGLKTEEALRLLIATFPNSDVSVEVSTSDE